MTAKDDTVTCPNCRNTTVVAAADSDIRCQTCNEEFVLTGRVCPICSTYHEKDEILCLSCGTPLSRVCQHCRHVNWSGHEHCINCGESLDILSQFAAQKGRTTADRLQEQMSGVAQIQQKEEASSIERMSKMLAIEEQRQKDIRRRVNKRKQEERRIMIIVGAALAFFILAAIILSIIGSAG